MSRRAASPPRRSGMSAGSSFDDLAVGTKNAAPTDPARAAAGAHPVTEPGRRRARAERAERRWGTCYRAATTPRRTRTNHDHHRPLGSLIQQRVRFAQAVWVTLRIVEALRRLMAGNRWRSELLTAARRLLPFCYDLAPPPVGLPRPTSRSTREVAKVGRSLGPSAGRGHVPWAGRRPRRTKAAAVPRAPRERQISRQSRRASSSPQTGLRCWPRYSITRSAAASRLPGTVSPSACAVLRLIARSNFVGSWTGRAAGFVPLRMRSA